MSKQADNFIQIKGSATAVGHALGIASRKVLRQRIQETRRIQRVQRIPDAIIDARVKDLTRLLRKICPSWLSEAGGVASAAGVKVEDILMLSCLPADFYPPTLRCTGFVSVGKQENRLLKIRDNLNHAQSFHIQASRGMPRLQIGRDIGNLGCSHVVSEHGLVGGCHTGSITDRVTDEVRFDDCLIMRYLAEKAHSVVEIPKVFERLLEANAVGGASAVRGALYIFADTNGALLLESVSDAYVATPLKTGTHVISNHFITPKAKAWESEPPDKNTLLRRKRMEEILKRDCGSPEPEQVFAMTRDRRYLPHSLCNDDKKHAWMTVSSQFHVIPRKKADNAVSYVCCGNTRHSVYVPVPFAATESYAPLLSGAFYEVAGKLYKAHGCNTHLRSAQKRFERWAMDEASMGVTWPAALALLKSGK
jgi:Acyl-coenzyme A:6-aminopenicillanic acid acyl-transferase